MRTVIKALLPLTFIGALGACHHKAAPAQPMGDGSGSGSDMHVGSGSAGDQTPPDTEGNRSTGGGVQ